jgi:hypothetical protein
MGELKRKKANELRFSNLGLHHKKIMQVSRLGLSGVLEA